MSEWQARVFEDFERFGVSIVWSQDAGNGTREVSNGTTMWTVTQGQAVTTEVEPLRLPDDYARALLAALLRHYNGADDARMLRKDYDAERARVDRLINALLPAGGAS